MIERILNLMILNGVNAKQLTSELELSSSSITEWKKGKAKFIVRGGTFVNFDPSHPNTDDASTYVEEGYKVIQEQKENGDIWYTVV